MPNAVFEINGQTGNEGWAGHLRTTFYRATRRVLRIARDRAREVRKRVVWSIRKRRVVRAIEAVPVFPSPDALRGATFVFVPYAGVTPMFELGFTPKVMVSADGPYEDRYPDRSTGGTVHSPPKDLAKWQEMIRTVVAHMVQRYGRATVAKWYFEVWNEPDISYWHGTPEQYFDLYDHTVAGVRAALPEAKVGGPATTGPGGAKAAKFLDDFLAHGGQAGGALEQEHGRRIRRGWPGAGVRWRGRRRRPAAAAGRCGSG